MSQIVTMQVGEDFIQFARRAAEELDSPAPFGPFFAPGDLPPQTPRPPVSAADLKEAVRQLAFSASPVAPDPVVPV